MPRFGKFGIIAFPVGFLHIYLLNAEETQRDRFYLIPKCKASVVPAQPEHTDQIQFSVIIPTYNRLEQLFTVVKSLLSQEFNGRYEIIVVNDGSTDGTANFLREMESSGKVTGLHQHNQGPSAARNLGIDHARGSYVAFIDDDCEAPQDWLKSLASVLDNSSVSGCGGTTVSHKSASLFGITVDHMVNYFKQSVNALPGATGGTEAPFLTSNNVAYRTDSLRRVGGFDVRFRIGAEERDLNNRIVRAGGRLHFEPSICVIHWHRTTLNGFLRHQFDQGKGSYKLYNQKSPDSPDTTASTAIPASVYIGLLFSPLGKFGLMRGFSIVVLIVLAHMMIVLGYLSAAVGNDKT